MHTARPLHKAAVLLLTLLIFLMTAPASHAADSVMSKQDILDMLHPVGSYYDTSDGSFDPNTEWGGTWVKETDGRVLIAANGTYAIGSTGGEATHVLTPAETAMIAHSHTVDNHTHSIPAISGYAADDGWHSHTFYRNGSTAGNAGSTRYAYNGSGDYITSESAGAHTHSVSTNGSTTGGSSPGTSSTTASDGSAHNNMQPYKAVNRWRRTA